MLTPNRRLFLLIVSQLLLCWLETYLISKISLIGKIGIATVYKEYHWLRIFWKTYLILSIFQIAVILTLYMIEKRSAKKITNMISTTLFVAGLAGLVLTFQDFLHDYAHRLLKERFHLGFYIFWLSWMATCAYWLFSNRTKPFPLDPNAPAVTPPPHQAPQPASYTPRVEQDS
jgi:hypothetical protein